MKYPILIGPSSTIALAILMTSILGCGAQGASPASSEAYEVDLDQENGGLSLDDESPKFGDGQFNDLQIEVESDGEDALSKDAEIVAMEASPDAAKFAAWLAWGQPHFDKAVAAPMVWDGEFRLNRGALLVRRTLRFEPKTDELLPRAEKAVVAFKSTTKPHHDGLLIRVIDPTPSAAEPLTLAYDSNDGKIKAQAELKAMMQAPAQLYADDAGNRMVAQSISAANDACKRGMIGGVWFQSSGKREHGRILGVARNALGVRIGHLRGVSGSTKNKEDRFVMKLIDNDGKFLGLLSGTYADADQNRFTGVWKTRAGEVGVVSGAYRKSDGRRSHGQFLGQYAENACKPTAE